MMARSLTTVIAHLFLSSGLEAQVVRGVAVEAGEGTPIAGGTVVLLDGGDARVGAVLTDGEGRFQIRAPEPGRYRLRLERIGYAAHLTPVFDLAAGEVHEHRLQVRSASVQLAGIQVTGRRRCDVRPQEGLQTQVLWEEARKALTATVLTADQRRVRVQLDRYEREVDAESGVVVSERTWSLTGVSERPFASAAAEELAARGFVWVEPDGWRYHAPDAEVLLSDPFLNTHCFRVVEGEDTTLIGLAFEPHRRRRTMGVRGVLWLDRASAELRHLEYGYTGLPPSVQSDHARGYVGFERMPGGLWIVRRWWIRMPRPSREEWVWEGRMETRERVVAYREEGGEALVVPTAGGVRLPASGFAVLQGMVFDSTRGLPLRGATVFVSGTTHTAVTDSAGRFSFPRLREGTYRVGFRHPRADSLRTDVRLETVRLPVDDPEGLLLAIPSEPTLLSQVCSEVQRRAGAQLVAGLVRDASTGETIAGAEVTLKWGKYWILRGTILGTETETTAYTDDQGRYRICAAPGRWSLFAAAAVGDRRSPAVPVADGRLVYHEIEIPGAGGRE
jgi:hypothetical protein